LLSDESHSMLENYGVWTLKKFMGKEYMGILRITYIINENGIVSYVYDSVKTKTHAVDILNDI
jgi:thioredoxin-dependent peroxiredoxin